MLLLILVGSLKTQTFSRIKNFPFALEVYNGSTNLEEKTIYKQEITIYFINKKKKKKGKRLRNTTKLMSGQFHKLKNQ